VKNQKDIIRAWLQTPVTQLKKYKDQSQLWRNHDQRSLDLLLLHETNPADYERMVEQLEEKVKAEQFKIDVLTEIIRRK
jgi:hypothetical protein